MVGCLLAKQNKFDEAIENFLRFSQLYPEYAPLHFALGLAYSRQGANDFAIAAYEKCLFFDPNHERAQENLAYLQGLARKQKSKKRAWRIRQ